MENQSEKFSSQLSQKVSKRELNSWRRGFTPQAEIWNGRMAIIGLIISITIVFGSNYFLGN